MCNCNYSYSKFIYNSSEKNEDLNINDNALSEYLKNLFGFKKELPLLDQVLQNWIFQQLRNSESLKRNSVLLATSQPNMFNFSLAKTYKYFDTLKELQQISINENEVIKAQTKFTNLKFDTEQVIENKHVQHLSENVSRFEQKGELLEYVARMANTRIEHKDQNGTIRYKTDIQYWNKALELLGEFNCNCSIEVAAKDAHLTSVKPVVNSTTTYTPSEVDLKSGKLIYFKETLPVFQDVPPIVRRVYKKNGF